jgi:hypothetical protein
MSRKPDAGWYPDPDNDNLLRYFDGKRWSDETKRAPTGSASMDAKGLASFQRRREILENLKQTGGKYAKPFEKGELASLSLFGGDWNDYAQIVMNMLLVDTMLNVERELVKLNEALQSRSI